jgi:hypothetical protein
MIDRPIFLDDAKSGFNTPVGIQNENIGGWNLVPEFTPHGWAAAGHRALSFSPGDRSLIKWSVTRVLIRPMRH